MKITAFDAIYPSLIGSGGTTLLAASGSNSGFGGDVLGEPGSLSVVGLRNTVSLQSNLASGVSIGDVLTIVQVSGQVQARFATTSNSISSNALLRNQGGAGGVITVAASGSAYTVMVGAANTWDITLTANCTLAITGGAASGSESSVLLILRQDGTGSRTVTWPGSIVWAGGSAPTLASAANTVAFVMLETVDAGTTWYGFAVGGSSGSASPLTTKGDLWAFSTTDVRFAVGSNGTGIIADSAETRGLRWSTQALVGELLMQDAVSAPPVPLESDPGQNDWLYSDL